MVIKRYFDDSDQDPDEPSDKRMRPAPTRPSLASVVGEVVMVKNLQNLFSGLEPLLRRVVSEEVERVMRRSITRCPSLRIEAGKEAGRLELRFKKRVCLPIFTGSRIVDVDGKPMEVILVDTTSASTPIPTSVPHPVRVEVVVVDGDFPVAEAEDWAKEDFDNHIVRQRTGKRPLLTGEVSVTMRDGIAYLSGDIEFTDNSSWIRSRKFRVAVRAMAPPTLRIREGITEPFVVKDHRGELYKKHHPPMLEDEVWRLEKIGKDGAFHKKLSSEGINTVQEFLKLSVVDPHKLRKILGIGMSDKMWEVTLKHARNCEMGNKLYIYRGSHFALFLNPICQVVRADINGHIILGTHLNNINNKSYIEKLEREAYARWNTLEEAEGLLNDNISLLTQVEQIPESRQASVVTYDHNDYFGDKSREAASSGSNAQMGCMEWSLNPTDPLLLENANIRFSFSGDNTTTPSASASVNDTDGPAKWH